MRRVVILGTSGSGKTTLARELAGKLGVPHIELDAINWWKPNWTQMPDEQFRAVVDERTAQPGWAVDGNYRRVQDLIWARADTLIWLDYPMRVAFWRVFRRCVARSIHRTELWNGNRESLWLTFCSTDSLLVYVVSTWRRYCRDMPKLLAEQRAGGKRILRFRSPAQARQWLAQIKDGEDYSSATASSVCSRRDAL